MCIEKHTTFIKMLAYIQSKFEQVVFEELENRFVKYEGLDNLNVLRIN